MKQKLLKNKKHITPQPVPPSDFTMVPAEELPPARMPLDAQLIRSRDALALLQVTKGVLQNYRRNGTLPYFQLGGIILYSMDDIKRLANRMK